MNKMTHYRPFHHVNFPYLRLLHEQVEIQTYLCRHCSHSILLPQSLISILRPYLKSNAKICLSLVPEENLLSGLDWHQLADYVASYNQVRPHQSLDYKTPDESYKENIKCEQLLQSLDSIIGLTWKKLF